MNTVLSFFNLRAVVVFITTAFSLFIVLLALNIITINELSKILGMSPDATNALQQMASRLQEVTHNIIDIFSQLTKKTLNSVGIDNGYDPAVEQVPTTTNHNSK